MELTEQQERTLEHFRQERLKHNNGFLHSNQPARTLLDIIDTLTAPASPPPTASGSDPRVFKPKFAWDANGPQGPNWYPVPAAEGPGR